MTRTNDSGPRGWRSQVTHFLLGAATGMGVNQLTGAPAARAIGASVTLAALLAASTWLRAMPARAALVRYASRAMLVLGFLATVLAAFGPRALTPYMLFGAIGLTGSAVLIPTDLGERWMILFGVAGVGGGVTFVSVGIAFLNRGEQLAGVAVVGCGVTGIGIGVAVLIQNALLVGVTVVGSGIASIGIGIAALVRGELAGVAGVGFGTAAISGGVTILVRGELLAGVPAIGFGVAAIGGGVAFLTQRDVLGGITTIGSGVATVAFGAAILAQGKLLVAAAGVGIGVVAIAGGMAFLAQRELLAAIAAVGGGVAAIGFGVTRMLATPSGTRLKRWLTSLTQEPTQRSEQV